MLHLKNELHPMNKLKTCWESLDVTITANKRELVLGLAVCTLSGLVAGMLLSPKKHVTIGSNNGSSNCIQKDQPLPVLEDEGEGEE